MRLWDVLLADVLGELRRPCLRVSLIRPAGVGDESRRRYVVLLRTRISGVEAAIG